MTLHQNYVGVDVAKDWIDAFDRATGQSKRIPASDLKAFTRAAAGAFVVFEATGGYERALMDALDEAGVGYARVNPRQAREFARATGQLAKTDKVDARMLAEFGHALRPRPSTPASAARRRLSDLVARRDDLARALAVERQRLTMAQDAFVRDDVETLARFLEARRDALDDEIARAVKADETLTVLERRLRTVPGVGPVVAAVLVARLPELGCLDRRAAASLAGLAPHACDSGQRRGKRRLWGGRADVRRALYLAAFVASRRDPSLRSMRERLQANAKPTKVAIIAVARKLLTIINAMIRDQRDYVA